MCKLNSQLKNEAQQIPTQAEKPLKIQIDLFSRYLAIIKNYDFIKSKVNVIDKALKRANIKLIGETFHEHWIEKKN